MRNIKKLLPVAVGLVAGAVAGLFLAPHYPGNEITQATIANISAATGGLGSALGGIAAAIAAVASSRSASESHSAASELARIGKDSRTALGRAMKPTIELTLNLGRSESSMKVHVRNEWKASRIEAEVNVPGCEAFQTGVVPELSRNEQYGFDFTGLPTITEQVAAHASIWDGDSQFKHLKSLVVIRFSDQQGVLRHEQTYEADTLIDERGPGQVMGNGVRILSEREIADDPAAQQREGRLAT